MSLFDDRKVPRFKVASPQARNSRVPEGLWVKCPDCQNMVQTKIWEENHKVCASCGYHFRLSANERVALISDAVLERTHQNLLSLDPLAFEDDQRYEDKLKRSRKSTELNDALWTGRVQLGSQTLGAAVFDFRFMGGSMGTVVGESLVRMMGDCLRLREPAVVVSASGGARMQEGVQSLMQMAKVSASVMELKENSIPFISVLTDPTTGGVAASFAFQGDIILAEPRALIGFAGPRVIQQTIRQVLPPGFQRSEFLLEHGLIDRVVPRSQLKEELSFWLRVLTSVA